MVTSSSANHYRAATIVAFSVGWGFGLTLISTYHISIGNIIAVVWFLGLSVLACFIHPFGGYDYAFLASCLYFLVVCFCHMFITTTINVRIFVHFGQAIVAGGTGASYFAKKNIYTFFSILL